MTRFAKFSILLLTFLILVAVSLSAEEKAKEDDGFRWTVVPGPFYNPNLGIGIQVLPLFLYNLDKSDTVSPPSSTGGFLLFAKPDWDIPEWTFIGGVGQMFYIKQDTWRVNFNVGGASVVYKQYQAGNQPGEENIPIWAIMEGLFTSVGVKRNIWNDLFGGVNYSFQYYQVRGRTATDQNILDLMGFPRGWQFQSLLGADILWDSRNNQFAATEGILGQFTADFGATWLGGDNNYSLLKGVYNQYHGFDPLDKHVLAWQFITKTGLGDVPRDKYSTVGGGRAGGLRGYVSGEYQDLSSMEAQIEYRPMFTKRFGATVFAGVGTIYGDSYKFLQGPWLPAGGFGLRFAVIPDRRINARLDFAWGIDSFAVYFALGEAF